MYARSLDASLPRFLWLACFVLILGNPPLKLAAEPAKPLFPWDILWAGSFTEAGTLVNRGDLRIELPFQGLSVRTQLISKSTLDGDLPLVERWNPGTFTAGGGVYHKPSDSRLLYGKVDMVGLSARLRRPWGKAPPWVEYRKPSLGDLKTEPVSTKNSEVYLNLQSPALGALRGFMSALITPPFPEDAFGFGYGGGVEAHWNTRQTLRVEGLYTGKRLVPRYKETWFSPRPPLPEREWRLYALGLMYTGPFLQIGSDWAYADTFAYGRDLYGNLGIRVGNRPWRFSLTLDGAGTRYVGTDGFAPGAGFRAGGRLEYSGKKGRFLRLGTLFQGAEPGKSFDRHTMTFLYRFPRNSGGGPVRLSRTSVTLGRNAVDLSKITDTYEALIGIGCGAWGFAVSSGFTGVVHAEEPPILFPVPNLPVDVPGLGISTEVRRPFGPLYLRLKLSFTDENIRDGQEGRAGASLYAALRGKHGRLSLKIASADLPDSWTYTLSWGLRGES